MSQPMLTIGTAELRLRMRDILEKVCWRGRHVLVTRFGRPVAVLVPPAYYRELVGEADSRVEEAKEQAIQA